MPAQSDLFYFGLNNGPNAVAQFSKMDYRSAKITIQASSNAEHQLSEVYMIHDSKEAYIRQFNFIYTKDPFITYTATIDANNVYLKANSALPNTDLVIFATLFDNPVTAADKSIDLPAIMSAAMSIASLSPTDNTDYAAAMTSSLDKREDVELLNRTINDSLEYMQTAEFLALPDSQQNEYLENLANNINNTANTLNQTVQSDLQAYYDVSKKIESTTALASMTVGVTNKNVSNLMSKVLNSTGKSIFKTVK